MRLFSEVTDDDCAVIKQVRDPKTLEWIVKAYRPKNGCYRTKEEVAAELGLSVDEFQPKD